MRISPEVDEMMWSIANTGDFQAVENFKKQFPDFHDELSRRVLLVKDLKRARTLQVAAIPRPAFVPKARVRPHFTWPLIGGVVFSVAAVGSAIVYKVNSANSASATCNFSVPIPRNLAFKTHPLDPAARSEYKVVTSPSLPDGDRMPPSRPSGQVAPESGSPSIPNSTWSSGQPEKLTPSAEKGDNAVAEETHIVFKQTPLDTVIKAIASSFKTEIKSAPGMPNATVDVDDHAKTPREVLERLGHKYGFGVLDDGSYLLLVPTSTSDNSQPNP